MDLFGTALLSLAAHVDVLAHPATDHATTFCCLHIV